MNFSLQMESVRWVPLCYPHDEYTVFLYANGFFLGNWEWMETHGNCEKKHDLKPVKKQTKTTCPEAGSAARQVCA
jgi:hypothetical protein